jgi:hypothetical protein
MILLGMISVSIGAVLAQRFKIMILLPATVMVLMTAVAAGIAQTHTAWWAIMVAAIVGISMQVGYIVGLGIRHVLEAPLAHRPQPFRPSASARHPMRFR